MVRFYFDIRQDGKVVPDEEGMVFPDMEAVKREAIQSLIEIARDATSSHFEAEARYELTIEARVDQEPILEATLAIQVNHKR